MKRPTGLDELNGNFLTSDEKRYLVDLVGSDVTGRHAEYSSFRTVAQSLWDKLKP